MLLCFLTYNVLSGRAVLVHSCEVVPLKPQPTADAPFALRVSWSNFWDSSSVYVSTQAQTHWAWRDV